jgi:hypothetical protein
MQSSRVRRGGGTTVTVEAEGAVATAAVAFDVETALLLASGPGDPVLPVNSIAADWFCGDELALDGQWGAAPGPGPTQAPPRPPGPSLDGDGGADDEGVTLAP